MTVRRIRMHLNSSIISAHVDSPSWRNVTVLYHRHHVLSSRLYSKTMTQPHTQLLIVVGQATIHVANQLYYSQHLAAFWINAFTPFQLENQNDQSIQFTTVAFDCHPCIMDYNISHIKISVPNPCHSQDFIPSLIATIQSATSRYKLEQLINMLIDESISNRIDSNKILSPILRQIIYYIQQNIKQPITCNKLAAEFNISEWTIYSRFREELHLTPRQSLNQQRLQLSCHLLLTTHLPIQVIAEEVVMKNPSHFTSLFKQYYQMTPTQFRNKNIK